MPEPLSLPAEEMRRLGYQVVDRIVEHLEGLRDLPPVRVGDAADLRARVGGPPPEEPGDPDAALNALFDDVLPFIQHGDHPRFFARIGSPSNYVGVLADAAAAGFNVFTASWTGGSGPATVELVVLDWLRELCGLPPGSDGVLVSGGSVATLVGLAAARCGRLDGRSAPDAVVYVSDQTHAAVGRALWVLGFDASQLRILPADEGFRLDARAVRAAVEADRAAGRRPFCVVATAGTTSTGAVDPLDALADLCAEQDLWLHVDGAYGAPAVLWPAARPLLAGLGRADSLVLDPHKWLFQPYEVGCLLVREPGLLERTFGLGGVYLRDVLGGEVNFRDRSLQLTRGARALKLWLSIRVFGLAAFRAAIGQGDRAGRARGGAPAGAAGLGGRDAGAAGRSSASGAPATTRCRRASRPVRWRDGYAGAEHDQLAGRRGRPRRARSPRTTPEEDRAHHRVHGGHRPQGMTWPLRFSPPTRPRGARTRTAPRAAPASAACRSPSRRRPRRSTVSGGRLGPERAVGVADADDERAAADVADVLPTPAEPRLHGDLLQPVLGRDVHRAGHVRVQREPRHLGAGGLVGRDHPVGAGAAQLGLGLLLATRGRRSRCPAAARARSGR